MATLSSCLREVNAPFEDGLVHISQLSDKFVKHPSDIVSVGDVVKTVVLSVDTDRKRISLSMRGIKQH